MELRDRIAAVLEAADNDWAVTDTYLGMADAVIAQVPESNLIGHMFAPGNTITVTNDPTGRCGCE
jgi:hypothetical protein